MKYITPCPRCETHFLLNDTLITAYEGMVQCGHCEYVFDTKGRLTEVDNNVTSADEYLPAVESTFQKNVAPTVEVPELTLNLDGIKRKPGQYPFLSILFSLLLLLTFFCLAFYFLRGEIASEYPRLKPVLERACKKLKCTIDLPQNLSLISIGNSNMQKDDTYQAVINFSSSLQNNAAYAQAYPNIELTLTDGDNVPVIKKLITPKEYLTSKKKIEQGLAPHEVANIKIALQTDEASVVNYRVLLLY